MSILALPVEGLTNGEIVRRLALLHAKLMQTLADPEPASL